MLCIVFYMWDNYYTFDGGQKKTKWIWYYSIYMPGYSNLQGNLKIGSNNRGFE